MEGGPLKVGAQEDNRPNYVTSTIARRFAVRSTMRHARS